MSEKVFDKKLQLWAKIQRHEQNIFAFTCKVQLMQQDLKVK